MKALLWLADRMDLATEEQRARIELLKRQTQGDVENEDTGIIVLAPTIKEEDEENESHMGTTGETTPDDGTT